jgi:hypothetical protein
MRRALFLVFLAVLAAGCGEKKLESDAVEAPLTSDSSGSSTSSTSSGSSVSSTLPGGEIDHCPQRPEGSSPSIFDAAAGTYAAHLTAVDAAALSLSFDVVQWLTGTDAVDAYHVDNPADPDGPPNDYYVVNANSEVRTAPVGAGATVLLVRLAADGTAAVSPGTVDELPAYLELAFPDDVYWLTFAAGEIVEICEQYRP